MSSRLQSKVALRLAVVAALVLCGAVGVAVTRRRLHRVDTFALHEPGFLDRMRFTPDGGSLVLEAAQRFELWTIVPHSFVGALAREHGEEVLASGRDGTVLTNVFGRVRVRSFLTDDVRELGQFAEHASGDLGSGVAVVSSGLGAKVFSLATGKVVRDIEPRVPRSGARWISFSPDGDFVIFCGFGLSRGATSELFATTDGTLAFTLPGACCFFEGRRVMLLDDGAVSVRSLEGTSRAIIPHVESVRGVSTAGARALVEREGNFEVVSLETGRVVARLPIACRAIELAPSGDLVAVMFDLPEERVGEVELWSLPP